MNIELRSHALGELHRRLRVPHDYRLNNHKTVSAAVDGNVLDIATLARTAAAADDGLLLPWLSGDDLVLLMPAQALALVKSVAAHEAAEWGRFTDVLVGIADGTFTNETQVAEAFAV